MSAMELAAALDGARTLAAIDALARDLWRAYGAGELDDSDAERVSVRIEEARQRLRPKTPAPAVPRALVSRFSQRKRRCVSPDRAKSRARRRRLAYSGPLPPALAAGFTVGQLAVLRIVADEVRTQGVCARTLNEIAARAGVCVTTARNAIRLAADNGLLVTAERRRRGARSLPNLVKIVSREWRAWIFRGPERGSKKPDPTDRSYNLESPHKRTSGIANAKGTEKLCRSYAAPS